MRPVSLHLRLALMVSLIIVVTFTGFNYFFQSVANGLVRAQNQRRAELVTAQLAETLSSVQASGNLAALRNYALLFDQIHTEVNEVRIYAVTPAGFREVVTVPPGQPRQLADEAMTALREQRIYSQIVAQGGGQYTLRAAAPIETEGQTIGAVALRIVTAESSDLINQLNRQRLLLQFLALVAVIFLIFLLLRRLVYTRMEELLSTMAEVESGDLAARAPIGTPDEIGKVALGFNQMIERIGEIQRELEVERTSLADRVGEATAELAERNQQLETANVELFHLQRRLLQMERFSAAGQLAAQFAHEVGTPLNLISGHIQLLEGGLREAEGLRRIEIIRSQIERIERIVRRMMLVTRLPKPDRTAVNLHELVQQIWDLLSPTLARQHVSWVADVPPELPSINGSAEQLQQVFINLVDNSLDAMPNGGQIRLRAVAENEGLVRIEFEDSGHGMNEETRARIFDPLFTTKGDGRGTGLGLSIVQQIVKDHEGQIDVDSAPQRGTRVMIRLPTTAWAQAKAR